MPQAELENTVQLSQATTQGKESSPLDHAHLSRYTLSDRSLELEILRLFLAQIPLTIESLKFASMDKDWVVAAHMLKGSARAVGLGELAELGLAAEQVGGIGDQSVCTRLIAKIEQAAQEAEAYITRHYGA
ncbi:MAG: Hpt domain-containing protein [Alphaproteobacteria bacterium]|nr:Hpt domain-containing protein [Alphaproteobacteria bacterium]